MTLCRPCAALGTSRVKVAGPFAARSRTTASSAGVAAVLWATTRTRACEDDSMRAPFVGCPDGASPRARVPARSADLRQIDVEDERLVGPDRRRRPLRAVGEFGRDRQPASLTDLHPGDALVPALDDLPTPEGERERLLAPGGVELLAVLEED